jgi:cytochrome c biogenesis protein CcdA
MKYVLFIIGIILSLFGFIMVTGALIEMTKPDSEYSIATSVVLMVFLGILPFVGGIVLCVFTAKRWGKAKVKQQICGKCNRSLEQGWTACPHCGEKVSLTN